VPVRLRVGSRGNAVRDLQRELRRRGQRIAVDGAFGPATKLAVKRIQKRFGMRATGVADGKLLKRLGLPTRTVANAPARSATRVPGATPYLKLFPVAGEYTYFDDYGAPRGSGVHQGIDIMADRNTPLVAVDEGVIAKMASVETGLGGIYVWLRRADGVQYYYAHMESIAEGLEVGSRITVGQVLGGVGNSGDARHGGTHLHFEIRNEWTPINPYPHLQAVDPTARLAARARA
jgi:murein DD-endopeptidase MepM/ murein hydrolase activator NlpD